MGDRSQICIKDGESEVFLYAHWAGVEIYRDLSHCLQRSGASRGNDFEYLARIVFSRMIRNELDSETGFGIGVERHGDIEHPIPVVWADGSRRITWRPSSYGSKVPEDCTFDKFIERANAGEYDLL